MLYVLLTGLQIDVELKFVLSVVDTFVFPFGILTPFPVILISDSNPRKKAILLFIQLNELTGYSKNLVDALVFIHLFIFLIINY